MLAYVLALVVGLGSVTLYMTGFFFPEVHRKNDFIWGGVGLFYALVLGVCARRITGGVLLGQMASVALLGWFGWQTLLLRRSLLAPEQQTAIPNQDQLKNVLPMNAIRGLLDRITGLFRKGKTQVQTVQAKLDPTPQTQENKKVESKPDTIPASLETKTPATAPTSTLDTPPAQEESITPTPDITPETTGLADWDDTPAATVETPATPATEDTTPQDTETPGLKRPNPPAPELVEAAQQTKSPDIENMEQEAETSAGVELAPPAEPPGSGDPEDRQAALEAPATIEAVPIDPENPPAQT